ncbi:DnaJ protein homolog 2 [Durusdinium trenchii]|uniref:DnaJ protein homolog 2 n=1 Tax=Durusdinium trenchii TaxID=1381693 RepID=A0ABP0HUJ6_9DINO
MVSFYGLLGVTSEATGEEIKLAFKRRALQVHPDKGGSKEAFHLVYQAFETLADPEARERYDTHKVTSNASAPKQKAKPKKKPAQPQEKRQATPKPEHTSQASGASKPSANASKVFSHDKLLTKLYELMKGLTREVRSDIIQKEFTQKQRVLFEKWIVTQREAESERETQQAASKAKSSNDDPKEAADRSTTASQAAADAPCMLLGPKRKQLSEASASEATLSLIPALVRFGRAKKKQKKQKTEMRGVFRSGRRYKAKVGLVSLCISTRACDLPTAIEFLIILSSVTQRMQGASQDSEALFRSRLEEALEQSLAEHGRSYEDLSPRFYLDLKIGILLGRHRLRSPTVRSPQEVAKLHSLLTPFRKCKTKVGQNSGAIFGRYGPSDLEGLWTHMQEVVKEMWESAGEGRSAAPLRRIRARYTSHAGIRDKHLQRWERQHMRKNDTRVKRKPRQAINKLLLVRKLLLRWHKALKNQEQMAENQRRKVLWQRKKEEALKRKRAREEQAANRLRSKWQRAEEDES